MNKPTVKYKQGSLVFNGLNKSAILFPINHPDTENVSNQNPVWTSWVRAYDEASGRLETLNTIYIPE